MANYIKAPFNFVPLNKEVFYPDIKFVVSHDIPFSDGESGVIELELTAKTPIYVRNGHSRELAEDKSHSDYTSFSKNSEGKYFIPSTSLKGSIRNVLEIMSLGKMRLDERMKYSTREWDNLKVYDLMSVSEQNRVRCGYLMKKDNRYYIESHGKPKRINHRRLDEYFKSDIFSSHFYKFLKPPFDLNKDEIVIGKGKFSRKSARFKYYLLESSGKTRGCLENLRFTDDVVFNSEKSENRLIVDKTGSYSGSIVFTGQPDPWTSDDKNQRVKDKGRGKFYEFVFPEEIEAKEVKVDLLMYDQFRFFHSDSEDWEFWKGELEKDEGRIPVFFRATGNAKNLKLEDFGLAFLYKIPFKYSVKELGNKNQVGFDQNKPDLAESLFGFSNLNLDKDDPKRLVSSKGRIQFSHAFAVGNPVPCDERITILGSPKASYYPLYVEQTNGENGKVRSLNGGKKPIKDYMTYNDGNATLSGWKRYPVRNKPELTQKESKELETRFRPLPEKTTFLSKIRYHNLRPFELGSLLSAITFHGNNEKLCHSVGMAKPLGYGAVSVRILNLDQEKVANYMAAFEKTMDNFLKTSRWHSSSVITELFSMAYDRMSELDHVDLEYMVLSTEKDKNEFAQAKSLGEYLEKYTKIAKQAYKSDSLVEKEQEKTTQKAGQIFDAARKSLIEKDLLTAKALLQEASDLMRLFPGSDQIMEQLAELSGELKSEEQFDLVIRDSNALIQAGNWKEARLKLQNYLAFVSQGDKKSYIDARILECKAHEVENLTFSAVLDTSQDIDQNKGKIRGYLKKRGCRFLPDEDLELFQEALVRWRASDSKGDDKKWRDFEFKRSVWKEIIVPLTGEEAARKLFSKMPE